MASKLDKLMLEAQDACYITASEIARRNVSPADFKHYSQVALDAKAERRGYLRTVIIKEILSNGYKVSS